MNRWVVLLRGINVGGRNKVAMKPLALALEKQGCEGVSTYIQSGNLVLSKSEASRENIETLVAEVIDQAFGFRPQVMALSESELRQSIKANPFPEAVEDPKTLHLSFMAEPPTTADTQSMDKLKVASERYQIIGSVFYLHAPQGIGRSKLVEKVEKLLGCACTARNWRTVSKLQDMLS